MSQDAKPFRPIRADELGEFKGWDLPQVGMQSAVALQQKAQEKVQVVEEEIAAEKITVAELESIRETARLEGLAAGLEEGRLEGQAKGKEEGFAEGKKQGYQEGFKQGDAEVKRLQGLFQEMLGEFEKPVQQKAEEIEALLLNLVVQLAETVVGVELEERKELLTNTIRLALDQLPETSGDVDIRVNSSDQSYVEQAIGAESSECKILADDQITAGGFKMQAANTLVKHEVESRFEHVAEQLLASLKKQDDGHEPGA